LPPSLRAPDATQAERSRGTGWRRRCVVAHVEFLAADRHRPGRLVVAFDAPAAHADRMAHWLHALVDVLAVEVVR
jgi:hypothetical protein